MKDRRATRSSTTTSAASSTTRGTRLHFRVEGVIEYSGLLFIPSMRPFDLFHPDRKQHLKLYVKRVFITDDCEELMPSWLRFIRGVVDSEDLPLNVSREMLQSNPVLAKIKSGVTKRVLTELKKKAEKDPEGYATFWENFGAVLKEGLYESIADREKLLELCRFRSSRTDGTVSLADYVANMKDGQDAVYYITGEDIDAVKNSPQLEGFRAKGVEVLFMTDPVDDFWISAVGTYDDKPFKSVTRGGADLSAIKAGRRRRKDAGEGKGAGRGGRHADRGLQDRAGRCREGRARIRPADRQRGLPGRRRERHGHASGTHDAPAQTARWVSARILEINPTHRLIKDLAARAQADATAPVLHDAAHLLLDQARILEGEPLPDPAGFARRMSQVMEKGIFRLTAGFLALSGLRPDICDR